MLHAFIFTAIITELHDHEVKNKNVKKADLSN